MPTYEVSIVEKKSSWGACCVILIIFGVILMLAHK